ncbi:MAG TPA: cysteine hydrolase family protein [Noviherbaspirillum sp.]|nr:cysteine hydrolase family protein [Noviherbaspirillum sp.]
MPNPKTLADFAGLQRQPAHWSSASIVVVDPQLEYITGRVPLEGVYQAVEEIGTLLSMARAEGAPVFHIVHHGRPGSILFDPDGPTSKIIPAIEPASNEKVIVKGLPNAFAGTSLKEELDRTGRKQIIVCGFATHMCVSATTRSALDHGFQATVVAAACATRDLPDPTTGGYIKARDIHCSTLAALNDRFALVVKDHTVWLS